MVTTVAPVQMLLAQFSQANSKLAVENDKLRSGRQALANDHAEVLNEIEYLRGRLNLLEGSSQALVPGHGPRRQPSGVTPAALRSEAEEPRTRVEQIRCVSVTNVDSCHIDCAFAVPNMRCYVRLLLILT